MNTNGMKIGINATPDVKSIWEFDEETHSHFLKRIGFREREAA